MKRMAFGLLLLALTAQADPLRGVAVGQLYYQAVPVEDVGWYRAKVGARSLRFKHVARYYQAFDAGEALEIEQKARKLRLVGLMSLVGAPAAGALLGHWIEALAGHGQSYARSEFGSTGFWSGAGIGAAAGLLSYGTLTGMASGHSREAAAVFNRRFAKDLKLGLAPDRVQLSLHF